LVLGKLFNLPRVLGFIKGIVVFALLILLSYVVAGCTSTPDERKNILQDSFVIIMQSGKSYRVTPDLEKLKSAGNNIFHSESSFESIWQQFKQKVNEAVKREVMHNPNVNVVHTVFATITGRQESGESIRPIELLIGDYASIEELNE
jgi:hypothetical protein